jgi:hypothetical protein
MELTEIARRLVRLRMERRFNAGAQQVWNRENFFAVATLTAFSNFSMT